MRLLDFPHSAYKVTTSSHVLFSGASASSIALTGTVPTVSFRCQVRLYTATNHTDCVGSVVVNAETLSFTQASKKVTTTLLTALPTVTSSNLDCMVEIIAIDAAGNIIVDETATAVKIRFEPTSRAYINPQGQWIQSSAYCMIVDPTIVLDSVIRYNGLDYIVTQIEAFPWLDGTELYRIIYFA
jgi:hypothetical protein